MNQPNVLNLTGWFGLIQTAAAFLGFTTLMLFFMKGGLWGPINDVFSVIWALTLIPLAGWLFLANRQVSLPLNVAAAVSGIGAMLVFAILQSALVVGMVRYEQTIRAIMTLTGVIGLWLILNALMARVSAVLPPGMSWVILTAGIGLLLSAVGYFVGGEQHPMAAIGYVVGFIAGMVWLVWLGWYLLTRQGVAFQ